MDSAVDRTPTLGVTTTTASAANSASSMSGLATTESGRTMSFM